VSSRAYGFRGPNQDATIEEQLRAGIRGFQIDAYPGIAVGESVATDLPATIRQRTELPPKLEALGRRLQRALRPRTSDRDSDVYLCHTFCELGALPMRAFLEDLRDFLDESPGEVIVVVVEDYVPPSELRRVIAEAGLGSMLFAVPGDAPLPTLGEMVRSGKRLLVVLENGDGGPELHNAFTGLVEETPYTFTRASQLGGAPSCATNRGATPAPIFQLNHWVTPARARGARLVNGARLRQRLETCEDIRGRSPTLVAVDFVGASPVVDVVAALNRR